jgi:1-acyl-sn-glycerol-3-phosphate acyltransferase
MIRALVLLFTIIVLGAPSALIFIPWALITGNALPLYNASLAIVRIGYRLVGIRIVATGQENVPPNTACIFMANHVSNLDPPALLPRIPGRTSAFVKSSLMKIPVFRLGPSGWASSFP